MKRTAVAIALVVIALCSVAIGEGYGWQWFTESYWDSVVPPNDLYLTHCNGAHAVAVASGWTSVTADVRPYYASRPETVYAYEWDGDGRAASFPLVVWQKSPYVNDWPGDPCVAANDSYKLWICSEHDPTPGYINKCKSRTSKLHSQDPGNATMFTNTLHENFRHSLAGACFPGLNGRMVAAFTDHYDGQNDLDYGLLGNYCLEGGTDWQNSGDFLKVSSYQLEADSILAPSLAMGRGDTVYVAYDKSGYPGADTVIFERSVDKGASWPWTSGGIPLGVGGGQDKPARPCIAAVGPFVFVCWHSASDQIVYRFSNNSGGTWYDEFTIPLGVRPKSHLPRDLHSCGH